MEKVTYVVGADFDGLIVVEHFIPVTEAHTAKQVVSDKKVRQREYKYH